MREILFRGKRIDNGEWVEGSLINDGSGRCFIAAHPSLAFGPTSKDEINGETLWGFYPFFEIDQRTIGQYIGFTANGKRIFDGDILDYFGISYVVSWSKELLTYIVTSVNNKKDYLFYLNKSNTDKVYVIGNIHDNPELLEDDNDTA